MFLFFFVFSSTACSTLSAESSSQTPADPVVPPIVEDISSNYRINPFDLLDISVYQEPDLTKTVRVTKEGFISFPLIGKVQIAGLDILAAEQRIAELLEKDYLVNPSVTVLVKEYNTKKVFVMGEVKTPGSYNIPQDRELTVLESIALAGGFSNVAAIDNTKVIRVENGSKRYINVKISDITKRGDKAKDLILKPNDIIFVPERIF